MNTVKVSVVIASYNTGPGIEWTISSLVRQTLPLDEYQIVVVDDGSTDDTFGRLQELSKSYPNLTIDRIQNSGWPGRPRNVGVSMSRGEYVFFMDHDDAMFPEALERMYDFAVSAHADVLIPKEVVDGWHTPGWPTWRENVARVSRLDHEILGCITPHKLYRRKFLIEQGIAFPEGRIRLEDFDFNAQVFARTDRIAVYSEYPCYTWFIGEGNSHKAKYDVQVYWDSFERSLQPIVRELPHDDKRDQLLIRWYRSRILERLNPQMLSYSETWQETLNKHFTRLLHYFPEELDAKLQPPDRLRSTLLRRGDWAGLRSVAQLDKGVRLLPTDVTVAWKGDKLAVKVTGVMNNPGRHGLRFRCEEGRIRRNLPADLNLTAVDDVTEAVHEARVDLIVRSRDDKVDWNLPTKGAVTFEQGSGDGELHWAAEAELDVASAAFGQALHDGVWDLVARVSGLGWTPATRLHLPKPVESGAVIQGRTVVPYTTVKGTLAIDIGSNVKPLVEVAGAKREQLRLVEHDGRAALEWPLPGLHVPDGEASLIDGSLLCDGHTSPARIIANAQGATLLGVLDPADDSDWRTVRARFGSVVGKALFDVLQANGQLRTRKPRRTAQQATTNEAALPDPAAAPSRDKLSDRPRRLARRVWGSWQSFRSVARRR